MTLRNLSKQEEDLRYFEYLVLWFGFKEKQTTWKQLNHLRRSKLLAYYSRI